MRTSLPHYGETLITKHPECQLVIVIIFYNKSQAQVSFHSLCLVHGRWHLKIAGDRSRNQAVQSGFNLKIATKIP